MLNYIVKWSIAQRWLVVIASIIINLWGFRVLTEMPLDVFPNFASPQVEIKRNTTTASGCSFGWIIYIYRFNVAGASCFVYLVW